MTILHGSPAALAVGARTPDDNTRAAEAIGLRWHTWTTESRARRARVRMHAATAGAILMLLATAWVASAALVRSAGRFLSW